MPNGLELVHIERSVDFIEKAAEQLIDLYYEQANVFSAIVGILGAKALHAFSPYKRHKHPDIAQQRFPDLSYGGKLNPSAALSLESKGSTRPWALQSHYDHPGWYIVWRYTIDPTRTLKTGKTIVVWRVDVAFLKKEDWKYEGSKAGSAGGGRTHTFGLKNPKKKLTGAAAHSLPGIVIRSGKPIVSGRQ